MVTTIITISDNGSVSSENPAQAEPAVVAPAPKKRKKSRYQAAYGRNFKKLKKAHPRWAFKTIAKKAHSETKKQIKVRK